MYSEARDADALTTKALINEMPVEMENDVGTEMCIKFYK